MIFLFDICTLPWWLLWLLLPLLGLLLGWLLWGRYRSLLAKCEADLEACRKRSAGLEEDLAECRKSYTSLENENATLRGKIRELETRLDNLSVETSEDLAGSANVDLKIPDVDLAAGVASLAGSGDQAVDDSSVKVGSTNMYAALKEDNLQVIEGIGPKMESVMKENGVQNWSAMASKSSDELKAILSAEQYGRRYQIIDPTTWPEQAALARDGQWEELIALQKDLDTGRNNAVGQTDSKVEKLLIKLGVLRKFEKDDLKVVEGIGPKIEELLKDNGVPTWAALAESSTDRLQSILDAAGDRFKLADPGTWPRQAKLASEGKWDELREYQDFLQGGRE